MKWRHMIIGLFAAAVLFAGCSPAGNPPAPTAIKIDKTSSLPRTPTSTPSVLEDCQPNHALLDELAASLPFEQAEVAHQAYGGENSLMIWLVSPKITQISEEQNQAIAEEQAIQAAKALLEANTCLLDFDALQLTVVDAEYRLWFSGSIRTIDLPSLQSEQTGGGTETEQGGGREEPLPDTLPTENADACTWVEAAARLREDFSTDQVEAVFTFVRDVGGNNIYAQWMVPDRQSTLNVIEIVAKIAGHVSCLHPPPTGISILLTLPDGQTLLTGYQPIGEGQSIDPGDFTFSFIDQP
jgi:hypothetical protein